MQENHNKREAEREKLLREARRLVVKVGTNTVTEANGDLCAERVEPIVHSIAALMKAGRQVVLVSSGAVGLGRGWLGLHRSRLDDLATKQACAAVGQSLLMDAYKKLFSRWEVKVAQVLLTEEDFTNWSRYSSLRRTMEKLLGFGVLPIVNENDTVSTAELESVRQGSRTPVFSDNDRLAGLVMSGMEADALVLLTNVDGLLGPASHGDASGEVIPVVTEITTEVKALGAGSIGKRTRRDAHETGSGRDCHELRGCGSDRERQRRRRARADFCGGENRDDVFANAADARQAAMDRVCGGRSGPGDGGRGRATGSNTG